MATLKTSGHAPVNGLQMYYEVYGEGEIPLVLIHGGGSTIQTSFKYILPLLAAGHKVIAVELQAHGRTSDRDAPETFEQDADDVAGLLHHLKVEKANILGYSNGGTTVLQIAIRQPEMVNKIVVVSGAFRRDGFIPGFFDGFTGATLASMPQPLKEAFLAVTPDAAKLQTMFEKDVARMVNFTDIANEAILSITAPAMFMSSDMDVVTVEHTLKMKQMLPNAQMAVLPGGHGAFIGDFYTTNST